LSSRSHRPDLPIVLYTGFGDQLSGAQLRDAGIRAMLQKPVQPQQLAEVLRTNLPPSPLPAQLGDT
jgi:FixJ family two-component response regulator